MKSCYSEIESMLPTLFVQHVNKLAWEENDIVSIVSTANQPGWELNWNGVPWVKSWFDSFIFCLTVLGTFLFYRELD